MKKLLNTLYVLTPESYLFVRNETVCICIGGEEKAAVPAISIDSIVCFGQMSVSTPLIGFCAERGISLVFLSMNGRFYARVCGPVSGNVLLRRQQYRSLDNAAFCSALVRDILLGKIRNSKGVLMRCARNAQEQVIADPLYDAAEQLGGFALKLTECENIDSMRGLEGAFSAVYFSQFDNMLRTQASEFKFEVRSRRPPRNEVNAVLSFVYTLLTRETQSALEAVGIDPAAGYLHTLRPGRPSLALDMLEELRAPLCDRFVLTMFNRKQLTNKDFETDSQAVYLSEAGRRKVLSDWQKRKGETIQHPFLDEKLEIGMIPYAQAMLLARVLRGDMDRYPPFVWR